MLFWLFWKLLNLRGFDCFECCIIYVAFLVLNAAIMLFWPVQMLSLCCLYGFECWIYVVLAVLNVDFMLSLLFWMLHLYMLFLLLLRLNLCCFYWIECSILECCFYYFECWIDVVLTRSSAEFMSLGLFWMLNLCWFDCFECSIYVIFIVLNAAFMLLWLVQMVNLYDQSSAPTTCLWSIKFCPQSGHGSSHVFCTNSQPKKQQRTAQVSLFFKTGARSRFGLTNSGTKCVKSAFWVLASWHNYKGIEDNCSIFF